MSTPVQVVEAPDMTATPGEQPLLPVDRCERCGAQAYVRTRHEAGDLLWCKHHFEENEDNLAPFMALDERHKLTD